MLEKGQQKGWAKPTVVDNPALGMLHMTIVDFFAQGPAQASIKISASNITIISGEATIRKHCYLLC